jgi:hypothetical protein
MLQASFRLISDPVAALRAVAEIVREEAVAPGNWGWEYGRSDFFYENELDRLGIDWDYDDSGFGDLAEPNPADANQMSHFIGIAYISAYEYRESSFSHGTKRQGLVRGNEFGNDQSAKKTDIEVDLGLIAWDMGKALVVNPVSGAYQYSDRTEITTAVQAIGDYDYASSHPIQNWLDSR